ncbi:hypothetical protein LTR62_004859 [Meristemomyces frigidus]|uniref:Ribosome biogenesis regulatory protein n=1 Tax=Meristemomyces frigidus TaxID=1508187 RepID=A0AAN7TE46_9PEZI|nr:hypothetical protein LTR62_004859 [Meristemomyces frigidus]
MEEPQARAQPYTYDLGHLLCDDTNPLPAHDSTTVEATLSKTAQQCAQGLINQLLTACPIVKSNDDGALHIKLPAPSTRLPREKPVPKPKEKTTWEKFAEKKGIGKTRKEGNLKFDEASGEWKKKYGYKGKSGGVEGGVSGDWLTEVDVNEGKGGDKMEGVQKGPKLSKEGLRVRETKKRGANKRR